MCVLGQPELKYSQSTVKDPGQIHDLCLQQRRFKSTLTHQLIRIMCLMLHVSFCVRQLQFPPDDHLISEQNLPYLNLPSGWVQTPSGFSQLPYTQLCAGPHT